MALAGFGTIARGEMMAMKLQHKSSSRLARREALTLRSFEHENICKLVQAFQTPTYFALLMELCNGDLNRLTVAYYQLQKK